MVTKIDLNALRDLITVCRLIDAEDMCSRSSPGVRPRLFFYFQTQDGLRRVFVAAPHALLADLNHTYAGPLKQILAAADGKLPTN